METKSGTTHWNWKLILETYEHKLTHALRDWTPIKNYIPILSGLQVHCLTHHAGKNVAICSLNRHEPEICTRKYNYKIFQYYFTSCNYNSHKNTQLELGGQFLSNIMVRGYMYFIVISLSVHSSVTLLIQKKKILPLTQFGSWTSLTAFG